MILVTGASGYLGSHIVRQLIAAGKPVRAMVRNKEKAIQESRLQGLDVQLIEADVTKPETLVEALNGTTAVIHTVAIAIEKGRSSYEFVNYQGTVNIVDISKKQGVQRFINISQLGADPTLPYRFLASKGKAQQYVAASGLDWTAFRPSVIWGPEDEFANTFARLALITPLIFPIVGGEEAKFQPVWVDDVAVSVVKSLDDPKTLGQEYELGGPEILSLEEIERRTLAALGSRRIMLHFPMPVLRLAVSAMENLLPNPPVTSSLLELLAVSNVTQDNKLYSFIDNPHPFTLENISGYMKTFTASDTFRQLFGR